MTRTALAALAALLAVPATAGAAYRPTAEVTFDRTTPLAAPAITSIMRVPSGDDTTRSITARFPAAFTYNAALTATGCTTAQASTYACPESSRIGTTTVASPLGNGSGTVHLTDDFRLVLLVQSLGGVYRQRAYGTIRVLDDGSFELTFDDLPPIPITESRIALEGGARGMLVTPRRCGTYQIGSRFVSHSGAAVEQTLPLTIAGCAQALRVVRPRLSGKRIAWTLEGPATGTRVTIMRRTGGTWVVVSSRRLPAGTTSIPRPTGKGPWWVSLRALGAGGAASPARAVRF